MTVSSTTVVIYQNGVSAASSTAMNANLASIGTISNVWIGKAYSAS